MEKEKKIKVTQVASDLRTEPEKILEILDGLGKQVKKTGSLSKKEINLVIEKITQDNQAESFDAYFSDKTTSADAARERQKKSGQTKVQAEAKKRESKELAAKPEKSDKVEKGDRVDKSKKPDAGKPDKKNDRPDRKNDNKKSTKPDNQHKVQDRKSVKPADNNDRTEKKPLDGKRQTEKNSDKTLYKEPKNTAVRAPEPEKRKTKIQKSHGERTKLAVGITSEKKETIEKQRTVDTRGSYVDLDKYNERYEDMASRNNKVRDNYGPKKQKINQKSQKYNKKGSKVKNDSEDKMKRLELERARKQQLKVKIPDTITVGDLAERLKVTVAKVIKELMKLGVMASVNEEIDFDTAALVAEELGAKVEKEVVVTIEERVIDDTEDDEKDLKPRCPVVCIMGHVDHGKTSILDRIRHSHVQATEAGGITQAIGAYQVSINNRDITFLDTPGHEAFTAMRARGADITDIAVLVVAADDGVMPQTVESINHAKAANIPMIVAINKIDAPGANIEKIKEDLTKYEVVCEDWGGDTICVPVSAKTGEGIDDLLENILLVADVGELKANPDRPAKGAVIEARLDKGRGPVATLLVQKGTLHRGDSIIAGTAVGRVRVMTNHLGKQVNEAGPSVPVEITGLDSVPEAGDTFDAVADEKLARDLAEKRKIEAKETRFSSYQKVTLDNLFSQIEQGDMKELDVVVKADVQGSAEAVKQSLEKLSNDEVRVKVIHSGVGAVRESDVMLAAASNAIIVGFNVRPDSVAEENAKRDGVDIRLYRVIYDAIEEIQDAMKGLLAPVTKEVELGSAEVRNVFHISNVGTVAGSYVLKGKIVRNANARIVRDGVIIADDVIAGLKRFKDDAKEVAMGYECGISLDKFNDLKIGDVIEAYSNEEVKQ